MPVSIVKTKILAPLTRAPRVVRAGLEARLSQAVPGAAIVVSAPAGFGKTSLISGWFSTLRCAAAWLTLEPADNEPDRFFHYLAAALAEASVGPGSAGALEDPQDIVIDRFLTGLLNEITQLPRQVMLVLDDFHAITQPVIVESVDYLVSHGPPNLCLVIASRTTPPLRLAKLRTQHRVLELNKDDLRFTYPESRDFLHRILGCELPARETESLHARTEGWPAGLQLAGVSASRHGSKTNDIAFVAEYVDQEILSFLGRQERDFLLATSILARMNAGLCAAVCDLQEAEAAALLSSFERAHLFVQALDGGGWLKYHQLFAEALGSILSSQSPRIIFAYHKRAARWFAEQGLAGEALFHARISGDTTLVADCLQEHWGRLAGSEALAFASVCPRRVIETRPALATSIAETLLHTGRLEEAEWYLDLADRAAEQRVAGPGDYAALPGRIAIARSFAARARNDEAASTHYARQAMTSGSGQVPHVQAQALIGLSQYAAGNVDSAAAVFTAVYRTSLDQGKFEDASEVCFVLADILIVQGKPSAARENVERTIAITRTSDKDAPPSTADLYRTLADIAVEEGNATEAAELLKKAADLAEPDKLLDWHRRLAVSEAKLYWLSGDTAGALAALERAERQKIRNPLPELRPPAILRLFVLAHRGILGEPGLSQHKFAESSDPIDFAHEFAWMARARLALDRGSGGDTVELERLSAILESLLQAAESDRRLRSRVELLVLIARCHRSRGDTNRAGNALLEAIRLAGPEGYLFSFLMGGTEVAAILDGAEGAEAQTAFAHRIRALVSGKAAGSSGRGRPALLSDRETEVLGLMAGGHSNQEIADLLFVSLYTVKAHTRNIYEKMEVSGRKQAVTRARTLGLLGSPRE